MMPSLCVRTVTNKDSQRRGSANELQQRELTVATEIDADSTRTPELALEEAEREERREDGYQCQEAHPRGRHAWPTRYR